MAQQYDPSQDPSAARRPRPQSYQPQRSTPPPPISNDYSRARASSNLSPERPVTSQQPAISDAVNSAFTQNDSTTQVDPELVARITQQVIESLKLSGVSSASQGPSNEFSGDPALRKVITPPSVDLNEPIPPIGDSQQLDGSVDTQQIYPGSQSGSDPNSSEHAAESLRPAAPPREPTDDSTTLEKIWKPLFDSEGNPTERLGQFLRGLALHIIEDFDPPKGIVIPPSKMLKFYEHVKLPEEIYPWHSLFGGKMSNSSLSHVYRDLKCEHHFVQFLPREKPSVPALTPAGFEMWMSCIIRAHPELEYQRFAKAVLNMPISNADDSKERFPKELSRRLFPKESNMKILLDLEDAVLADPVIELTTFGVEQQKASAAAARKQSSEPQSAATGTAMRDPQPAVTQTQSIPIPIPPPPPPPSANPQRSSIDRQALSQTSSEATTDELHTTTSIERQRKPYHAAPGGGKVYDDSENFQEPPPEGTRQSRANSSVPYNKPHMDPNNDYYVAPRYRTGSVPSNRAQAQPPRQNSPPFNPAYGTPGRSESGMATGSYGGSGLPPNPPRDMDENALRQTVSWNDYPRADRMEPTHVSRDFQFPPPPPRDYDDETIRRETTYPPPPPPPPPPSRFYGHNQNY